VKLGEKPIELPSPSFVLRKMVDFRRLVDEDPVRARERMCRLFEQGRLLLHPSPKGTTSREGSSFRSRS